MELTGKVALITGSGQGIGRSIAERLAHEGATVIVNDVNEQSMNKVVDEIVRTGGAAFPLRFDVGNTSEVKKSIKRIVDEFEGIHILINNAIARRNAPFFELREEDWDIVLNTGLKGLFFCIQTAGEYMIAQRYGKIVNMSSVTAIGAFREDNCTYAATKAAVIAVTKVAAKKLGSYGINVNAIAPGMIVTPSQYSRRGKEGAEASFEMIAKSSVLGRVGQPEDIANLALFLVSDESSFITGQVIACEGGRTNMMLAQ